MLSSDVEGHQQLLLLPPPPRPLLKLAFSPRKPRLQGTNRG